MPKNPSLSLWPELDPPAAGVRNHRSAPETAADEPTPASEASVPPEPSPTRAPIKFCAYGGLTPWKRDYGTGRAICSRCARQKEAAGCPVLGSREIENYREQLPAPLGFTSLINPVGL